METRYKDKEEFEIALRKAPPENWLSQDYNMQTGKEDMPTLPHEMVREIADLMYDDIMIVKNTCSIEPVMGLVLIEMEILATPSYPEATQKNLFSNCIKRLIDSEGKVKDSYTTQRVAESVCYRDAFKSQGNIFGRNLRGKHGADFTLQAKEVVTGDPQPTQKPPPPQKTNTAESPI